MLRHQQQHLALWHRNSQSVTVQSVVVTGRRGKGSLPRNTFCYRYQHQKMTSQRTGFTRVSTRTGFSQLPPAGEQCGPFCSLATCIHQRICWMTQSVREVQRHTVSLYSQPLKLSFCECICFLFNFQKIPIVFTKLRSLALVSLCFIFVCIWSSPLWFHGCIGLSE